MGKIFKPIQKAIAAFHSFKTMFIIASMAVMFLFGNITKAIEFSESYLADIQKKYGEYPKRRLVTWEKVVQENRNKPEQEKLEGVNRFFNLLEYSRDIYHWGVEDYWATPLEFVVSGAGDCEDFSIGKYFTLLELGVPDDKLLIMYVKLKESGAYSQAHMVLLYYPTPDSIPLVLDNVNKEILPADKRSDLEPIYGFNGKGLWQAKELGKGNKIGQPSDLKRWVDLETRMKSGTIKEWQQ